MANVKIYASAIGEKAQEQISSLASLPAFQDSRIRIMPDCHAGAGCVIGFTADLGDKVIPNVVGVDIGCGMLLTKIEEVDVDFPALDQAVRSFVPAGTRVHESPIEDFDLSDFIEPFSDKEKDFFARSLGTLGGGNHFIEVDRGEDGSFYLLLHTGSRNLGARIADAYQKKAIAAQSCDDLWKAEKEKTVQELIGKGEPTKIPDALAELEKKYKGATKIPKPLCYLEGKGREEYLHDMRIAQRFAQENRRRIRDILFSRMGWKVGESLECVHNYIGDDNIIRKGAISARQGERLIIPLNMKDGVILATGKGNEDWNYSAPHGAGRQFSRGQAKAELSLEEFRKEMDGIYSTSISRGTLDEAPMAYKDPKEILEYLPQTARVDEVLKPVYNFKAS